jgi:hypothetical protein
LRVASRDVPPVKIDAPVHVALVLGAKVGLGMLVLSKVLPPTITISSASFGVAFLIASFVCAWMLKPADVRFGAARTFADLARVIAGERCAFPGFPVVMR